VANTLPLVVLNADQKKRLINYLDAEIKRATEAHSSRLAEDKLDEKFYEAKSSPKNFPWKDASNIRVPVARIMVDSVKARIVSAIEDHAPKLWTTSTDRPEPEAVKIADGAQSYMEAVAMRPNEMDMGAANESICAHLVRLGYAPVSVTYEVDEVLDRYYNAEMQLAERSYVKREGVAVKLVPGSHFLMPGDARDVQTARWVARKIDISWGTMKTREREKRWYQGIPNQIKGNPVAGSPLTEIEKQRLRAAGIDAEKELPHDNAVWRFWEVHLKWDPSNDGQVFDMVCLFHPQTQTIARLVYNWYAHRERPFSFPTYSLREDDPWSGGIVRRLRPLNVAIDTMLNQSIDNATAANTRIWKYQMNEPALKQGLEIWPSAGIPLKDVNNLKGEQLGEIYPSSYALVNQVQQWAERDIGLFDTNMGNTGALKSDVAATSVMATMQEGGTRLNTSIKELRREYGKIGYQAFMNYQQFNPVTKGLMYLGKEKWEAVAQLFDMPVEEIRDSLFIELTATTAALSRQIKRQDAMALWQILVQYYQQVIQIGQAALMAGQQSPGLAEGMFKVIDQSAAAFRTVLVDFEVPNPDSYLITSDILLGQAGRQENGNDMEESAPGAGVAGATAGTGGAAGFAGIPSPIQRDANGE